MPFGGEIPVLGVKYAQKHLFSTKKAPNHSAEISICFSNRLATIMHTSPYLPSHLPSFTSIFHFPFSIFNFQFSICPYLYTFIREVRTKNQNMQSFSVIKYNLCCKTYKKIWSIQNNLLTLQPEMKRNPTKQ